MDENKKGFATRKAALDILMRVEEEGAYVNLALSEVLSGQSLEPRDKRLAAEIAYGVITYRNTLDFMITASANRPAEKMHILIRQALRIGIYQLYFLDRVPASAAVFTTVELIKKSRKRALASFVNGVLRGFLRKKDNLPWPDKEKEEADYLALRYAHPKWMVSRWLGRLGAEETIKLLEANNKAAPVSIRVNTLHVKRSALQEALQTEGIDAQPSKVAPEGLILKSSGNLAQLSAYKSGHFVAQGESAMLCARIIDPQNDEAVLDGCSAPGGKTTHLAQLMENSGSITALDIYPHRLALVEANCRRLGVKNVKTVCLDARNVSEDKLGLFDRILLDVPCSGLGVIRRKPDLKWRRQEKEIGELANLQAEMVTACLKLLKPGGTLLYSTCTNEPEETEQIIANILARNAAIKQVDLRPYLPQEWHKDIGHYGIQLYPHRHQVDGFFISRLQKA